MRKFLDNLNNLNEFRGRHQTLKIHVQEKLHTHNFLRGAGVQESGKPPTAARPPGGGFRDFSILRFHAGFFRGFSRPLINHGERGRSRRKREKSTRKRRRTCKIQWISLEINRNLGVTRWNPAKPSGNAVKLSEIQSFSSGAALFSLCITWFLAGNKKFWEILQKHLTIYIYIYMIDCTKCCVTCTTSYIFYL